MQDPSQNQNRNTQIRNDNMELIMLQSDLHKNERSLEGLNMDLVRLKRLRDRVAVDMAEKEENIKKLQNEKMRLDEDIKRIKHKINLL